MKSNLRNEIKAYIVRSGCTMQEVVDMVGATVFPTCPTNSRGSLCATPRPCSWPMPWGTTSCGSAAPNRDSRPYRKQRAVCDGQSAKIFRVIADAKELRPDVGTQLFGLDMEKRWGRFSISSGGHRNARNPPRRAHGTLQPFGMKVL